jgi:hypothetical protein
MDSVAIGDIVADTKKKAEKLSSTGTGMKFKYLLALFVIFLIVVSNIFTENIVGLFGRSTTKGRNLTTFGHGIQGLFLVIFYALAVYLIDSGVL